MHLPGRGVEYLGPIGLVHGVKHFLRLGKILDPRKAVVVARVGHAFFVHAASEPFPAVHAHLDGKGKPGLNPRRHEAEPPIDPIVIEKLAFAISGNQFEHLLFAVAINLEGPARLDTRQHANQAVGDSVAIGDLSSVPVLANAGRLQVLDGPACRFRSLQRRLDQLFGHGLCVVSEILQQGADSGEIAGHSAGEGEHPQRASKNQPIPSAQHPDDMIRVFWYKSVQGVPPLWANVSVQKHLPHNRRNARFFIIFGCGYAALGGILWWHDPERGEGRGSGDYHALRPAQGRATIHSCFNLYTYSTWSNLVRFTRPAKSKHGGYLSDQWA